MSFFNDSAAEWEAFEYGDACAPAVDMQQLLETLRSVRDQILSPVAYNLAFAVLATTTLNIDPKTTGVLSALKRQTSIVAGRTEPGGRSRYSGPTELGERLVRAGRFLQLTQDELARLTGLSVGTIQNLQYGATTSVRKETAESVDRLLRFNDLLLNQFGNRRIYVSALLRTPTETFDGKAPLAYALESPVKFAFVVSSFAKMYG